MGYAIETYSEEEKVKGITLSKAEDRVANILREVAPGEWAYTGRGDINFGFTFNPDFMNTNGKKKIIEVFGCYWHACPKCKLNGSADLRKGFDRMDQRAKIYAQYGYDTLFVWEHEISNISRLKERIRRFTA